MCIRDSSVGSYHLRLSHKQESGNGLYLFVILAFIPKILSQGLTCGFPGLSLIHIYVAEIYTDGERSIKTRTTVKCSRYRVNSMTKLNFELKASGGSAVRLIPEKDVNKKLGNYKKQKL